ncbi:response regulator [Polaromonas sp. YR568]|uniref:response regulator n=1 Tax=Polaromonas sp. YR568 TaxID=1855301 RepID=UPI0031380C86
MTDLLPDFKPEPELRLTAAHLAMQQQLMELTGVAQVVIGPSGQLKLNSRACDMFGLDRDARPITLAELESLIDAADRSRFRDAGQEAGQSNEPRELDCRLIRPDGRAVELHVRRYGERDAHGRVTAHVLLALDITERKRVERALLETAERFRAMTALSSDQHWAPEAPSPSPVATTPPEQSASEAEKVSSRPKQKMRVLYVEDNMFNLMLFDEVMQTREDVELRIAQDGAKGFDIAQSWLPHVLVLDAHLPDTHGIDLIKRMRQVEGLKNTPVFMCSGDNQPEHKQAAKEAGFDGYWTKPVDIDKVFADLDDVANRTVFG